MPAAIDPAWEYWTPADPEVAELLADAAGLRGESPLSRLDLPRGDFGSRRAAAAMAGLRYGRRPADIDRGYFTLGRETAPARDDNAATVGVCRHCGDGFRLRRRTQRYCSGACLDAARQRDGTARRVERAAAIDRQLAANERRRAKLADFVVMYGAGVRMADIAARLRVSRIAVALWRRQLGLRRARPAKRKLERPERTPQEMAAYYARVARFAELYAARVRLVDIGAELGVDHTTLGRWRRRLGLPRRRSLKAKSAQLRCERCGVTYAPLRSWVPTRFCSTACALATTADKRRVRPTTAVCACGTAFTPKDTGHRYCSKRCAAKAGGAAVKPPADLLARFAAMYLGGSRMADIAAACGRTVEAVKKWRRQLGLPARPNGNLTASRTGG